MLRALTARDVLDVALRIELNGERLYAALADAAPNDQVRTLFSNLGAAEQRHYSLLDGIRRRAAATPLNVASELAMILDDMMDTARVTREHITALPLPATPDAMVEAVDFALSLEQQMVDFYGLIQRLIPIDDLASIQGFADEELSHIAALEEIRGPFESKRPT